MHKKIEQELIALANDIIANQHNLSGEALLDSARKVYEKLIVIKYQGTEKIKQFENEEEIVAEALEEASNVSTDVVESQTENTLFDSISDEEIYTTTPESIFERVSEEKQQKEIKEEKAQVPKTLNDALFKNNLKIELNDRIAFVKHLFNGSQEDFNRVLSQLNTFDSENEAKTFINTIVKPDYDWSSKEEYEFRLLEIIERKFL